MTRAVALTALIAILLAGCGGGSSGGDSAIHLKLTLWPDGEADDSVAWTLRCEPTGGDHHDPETACAALTAVADPFDVAVLDGDFRGKNVNARFSRESPCVSGRWDRIAPVFPTGS